VGRRVVFHSIKLFAALRGKGEGVGTLWSYLMKAKVAGQRLEPVTGQHMHIVLACTF
jgi:hypothetical protein